MKKEKNIFHVPHENSLGIIPVRPGTFFAFWDFSPVREKRISTGEFSDMVKIRLFNNDGEIANESDFPWQDRKAYIKHTPKPGFFHADILLKGKEGWVILCESNKALSPANSGHVNKRSRASMEFHRKKAQI